MKVMVIGLDGVTWELLRVLAKRGRIPFIERMMRKGSSGELQSTVPPVTAPAWASFATGEKPGQHGCFDFSMPGSTLADLRILDSRSIIGNTFYEILDKMGKKCVLVNLPVSFPPRIRNVVITDFLTRGSKYVFPESLVSKFPCLSSYRVEPKFELRSLDPKEFVEDIRDLEHTRFVVAKTLFSLEWDFFFVLFSGTDWVQHLLYKDIITGRATFAHSLYGDLDRYIGWFLTRLPNNCTMFVISDHGFRSYSKRFSINGWLLREGYLTLQTNGKGGVNSYVVSKRFEKQFREKRELLIPKFILKDDVLFGLLKRAYLRMARYVPFRPVSRLRVDLRKTVAYSIGSTNSGNYGSIYINAYPRFRRGVVGPREYGVLRDEIIEKLSSLVDPYGNKVFQQVLARDDVYKGRCKDLAPDIVLRSDEYLITKSLYDTHFLFENCQTNEHDVEGVFIAFGKDIREGSRITGIHIVDLAPTILAFVGVPIQNNLDGRVINEIFEELPKNQISHQSVE